MLINKILCIFAHPDDESFGPGGAIALWAKQGAQIHLICATQGQNGNNHTGKETGHIRSRELENAARILGIQKVSFLNFVDGTIGNSDLQILIKKVREKVEVFKPDVLLTFDLNGVSGHIDHMAVASAVTKVFYDTLLVKKLYYFSVSRDHSDKMKHYFIYFPDGKHIDEVDEVIDISSVYETKLKAMRAHTSQAKDVEQILKFQRGEPKQELFMVRTLPKKSS